MSYIYSIEGISRKEREREKFCVINVKYKEISWRVRKKKRRKKVTSRSTEELVLKKNFLERLRELNLPSGRLSAWTGRTLVW